MYRWSEEQRVALEALRSNPDVKAKIARRQQHIDVVGDRRLLRFLNVHRRQGAIGGFDIDAAARQYSAFLDWRDENKVDDIRKQILYDNKCSVKDFPYADIILKYMPDMILISARCTDYRDNLLSIEKYHFDAKAFLKEVKLDQFIEFTIWGLEFKHLVLEQESYKRERQKIRHLSDRDESAHQNDPDGGVQPYGTILRVNNIRDVTARLDRGVIDFVSASLKVETQNYPDLMQHTWVVTPNFDFSIIWPSTECDVTNSRTLSNNFKKTKTSIAKYMAQEHIPLAYGGKAEIENRHYRFRLPEGTDDGDEVVPYHRRYRDTASSRKQAMKSHKKPYRGPFALRKHRRRVEGDGFGIEGRDYKDILYRVYSKHNPEKLSDIDFLLERFKGREEDLVHDLEIKYSIEEGDLEADVDMSHPRTILYTACMQLGLDEKAVMFIKVGVNEVMCYPDEGESLEDYLSRRNLMLQQLRDLTNYGVCSIFCT